MDDRYFSAKQIAEFGIRGLPRTERNIHNVARREGWPSRTVPGRGGRLGTLVQYQPPSEVLRQIDDIEARRQREGKIVDEVVGAPAAGGGLRVEQARAGYVYLPLYEVRASAGHGAIIEHERVVDLLAFKEDWLRQELNAGARDVALLYVQGRSMEPDLRPGDVIMIDIRDTTAQREAIYVIQMDGALLVKELQRLPEGVIKVRSKNADYETFSVRVSDLGGSIDFTIVGRVVWACRRF